ncbi:mitogen activated kinase-like protein [Strigomonas culicis]|uniref:Mitogen activated kinase-like protein n=1 Tax=Strigomonas culicis TaxID=28005 RepID=S9TUM1_9TRYP|nr:mitogen activated kinase-like protein [Strigomonas culicis]EPY23041.1 mitogen activated kinase-like protein [Strigomonas culicis]|eukprot:EPY20253.1 mitogen activated kinase-like protein [Strigomonas culicis]
MSNTNPFSLKVESYSNEDVAVALNILQRLPKIDLKLQTDPNAVLTQLTLDCISVVRWYFREDPIGSDFVYSLNNYCKLVASGRQAEASYMALVVAKQAKKLCTPHSPRIISWIVPLLLFLILSLSLTVLLLTTASHTCCNVTSTLSAVLSGLCFALVLAVFPVLYLTTKWKVSVFMRSFADMVVETTSLLTNNHPILERSLKTQQMEETGNVGQEGFLLDTEAAFRNRKSIHAILSSATDDDGNVVLRPKGLSPVVASLTAIYRHTILIVTDKEGKVLMWSEGAAINCGFSARDTEGRNINTLLFGGKSIDVYATMTEGAQRDLDMTEKILTLAHSTLGSISVSASVVLTHDAETNEPVGYALVGSVRSDELSRTQSLFHNFFVTELHQLNIKDSQFRQLVDCLQYKNLRDLSFSSRDWSTVHIRRLLSESMKGRQGRVDVEVDPQVTELPAVLCDELGLTSTLTRTIELFAGKLRLRVEQKRTTDTISQFIVIYHHNAQIDKQQLKMIRGSVNNFGGLVVEKANTLEISVPFIIKDDVILLPQQMGFPTTKPSESDSLVVLLLEKNAVHRHNISSLIWSCGHSLRIVDNVKKALQAIESSTDLSCAIVDMDIRDAERVLDALHTKRIYTIATSETPDNVVKHSDAQLLKKPMEREGLLKEFENASKVIKRFAALGKVRNSPWKQGRLLGRGGFATVYEAISTLTNGKMAVKVINVPDGFDARMDDFVSEIEILGRLDHPNIIHYFYCEKSANTLYVFMALADQGTVADILKKCPRLPEKFVATILKQLLQAVNYLHESDVIHRDIKPANMLVSHGQMKLSDFGTATENVTEGTIGTLYYMAPEVIDGKKSGKESDVWSIGCVACECVQIVRTGGLLGYDAPSSYPSDISPELVDFIKCCLHTDPAERATAGALLLHDFIVHLDHEVEDITDIPPELLAKPIPTNESHTTEKMTTDVDVEKDGSVSSSVVSWSFQ